MEIQYGARVVDSEGIELGTVDNIFRDKWSGEIVKFKVDTARNGSDLLISPDDLLEATPKKVKLKVSMSQPQPQMGVEYGAEVFDKDGKPMGKVDFIAHDVWTGKVNQFKVTNENKKTVFLVDPENVLETTPTKVKLKITMNNLESSI
jgi:sporulation protein YlmC with PRC-barrel domain